MKKVKIQGVGEIRLERSRRARHVCLTVRPFAGVRVAVPWGVTFRSAEQVARSKAPWLKKQIEKVSSIERRAMELEHTQPIDGDKARQHLIARLHALSRKTGLTCGKVAVKSMTSRWGSCSAKNSISLNMQLVRLPAELIDYVILHELVHTRIKNHSKAFWDQLSELIGEAKTLDRQLNQYPLTQPSPAKQGTG